MNLNFICHAIFMWRWMVNENISSRCGRLYVQISSLEDYAEEGYNFSVILSHNSSYLCMYGIQRRIFRPGNWNKVIFWRVRTFSYPVSSGFLIGLLLDPETGSDTFLRNVRLSPTYKALQLRIPYSSLSQPRKHQIQKKKSSLLCCIQQTLKYFTANQLCMSCNFIQHSVSEHRMHQFREGGWFTARL